MKRTTRPRVTLGRLGFECRLLRGLVLCGPGLKRWSLEFWNSGIPGVGIPGVWALGGGSVGDRRQRFRSTVDRVPARFLSRPLQCVAARFQSPQPRLKPGGGGFFANLNQLQLEQSTLMALLGRQRMLGGWLLPATKIRSMINHAEKTPFNCPGKNRVQRRIVPHGRGAWGQKSGSFEPAFPASKGSSSRTMGLEAHRTVGWSTGLEAHRTVFDRRPFCFVWSRCNWLIPGRSLRGVAAPFDDVARPRRPLPVSPPR